MTINAHFSPFSRPNGTTGEKAVSKPTFDKQTQVAFQNVMKPQTDSLSLGTALPLEKSPVMQNISLQGTQDRAKHALGQVAQYYPELRIAEAAQKSV